MLGAGKYDDVCSKVRELVGIDETTGGGVVVIVIGGKEGHGFSLQGDIDTVQSLPNVLRRMAVSIDKDQGMTMTKEKEILKREAETFQSVADCISVSTAQLRHAYAQLEAGTVLDQPQFAKGLMGPEIVRLERLAILMTDAAKRSRVLLENLED